MVENQLFGYLRKLEMKSKLNPEKLGGSMKSRNQVNRKKCVRVNNTTKNLYFDKINIIHL